MTSDLPPLPRRTMRARRLAVGGSPTGNWFEIGRINPAPPSTYGAPDIRPMRDQVITIVFHAPDPDTLRLLLGIPRGWPLFYRRTWLMLEPAPARLALPWGNSAYTTITHRRYMPGDNPNDVSCSWVMGPPDNGLTPSREGARRVRAVAEQAAADMVNGTTGRMLAAWADIFETLIEETSMDKTVDDAWRAAGYTRKPTIEERHREALAALPPWTEDPLERLEHTLAAHADANGDAQALYATTCSLPGLPTWTGITWNDLRALAADLRAARTEQASHEAE
jgi:hypothetical protein